jgi:creatinine amidohydrolase
MWDRDAMTRRRFWGELKTTDFAALDPMSTIAVLPVAAIEQHGPHLPVMTDTAIMQGMIDTVLARLPDALSVLFLPIQSIGKSNEHIHARGTITLSAENLIRVWFEIGEAVHRAGLRKLVIINSHGGNSEVIAILTREFRVRLGMLAVATQWRRFGLPPDTYAPYDATYGIHAGDIEASLMLHFRPDLVDMTKAKLFPSRAAEIEKEFTYLRPIGTHPFGWTAADLNPDGAVGDAAAGTAEKGKATAEHQADGFIALLRDMANFSIEQWLR